MYRGGGVAKKSKPSGFLGPLPVDGDLWTMYIHLSLRMVNWKYFVEKSSYGKFEEKNIFWKIVGLKVVKKYEISE